MLTHKDLAISPSMFEALLKTRDLLRGSQIDRVSSDNNDGYGGDADLNSEERVQIGFNMNDAAVVYECGAVACIGGTMCLIERGISFEDGMALLTEADIEASSHFVSTYYDKAWRLGGPDLRTKGGKLAALFYPRAIHDDHWKRVTPAMAAEAIDNLLEHGNPKWAEIARANGLRLGTGA